MSNASPMLYKKIAQFLFKAKYMAYTELVAPTSSVGIIFVKMHVDVFIRY